MYYSTILRSETRKKKHLTSILSDLIRFPQKKKKIFFFFGNFPFTCCIPHGVPKIANLCVGLVTGIISQFLNRIIKHRTCPHVYVQIVFIAHIHISGSNIKTKLKQNCKSN